MKYLKISTAVAIVALGVSSLASAQPRNDRDDHRGPPPAVRHAPPQHGPDHRGPQHRAPVAYHHEGRGAGPDHAFYRGERLPPQYRSRSYVVNDYRNHHLNAPPRGYQWVQTGSDYVLAAIATGLIAQVILSN